MGASSVSLNKSEVYLGAQTGIVDGLLYSAPGVMGASYYEVFDYVNLWGVRAVHKCLIVDSAAFNALPKDLQDVVMESLSLVVDKYWDAEYYSGLALLDVLRDKGMEIVPVSDEELARAAALTRPVWDEVLAASGPEGLECLNSILEALGQAPYK